MNLDLDNLSSMLAGNAGEYDLSGAWPAKSWDAIESTDLLRYPIRESNGGIDISPIDRTRVYEAVAKGCMSTALILTQRDAATELIDGSQNTALVERLVPRLAKGEAFTTVGISQLTGTSTGKSGPLMRVEQVPGGFQFNGRMPWVTGADHADFLVTGGIMDDGRQVLVVMDAKADGVTIDPPGPLMALNATRTSAVRCEVVFVPDDHLLREPAANVLKSRSTVKPLVVSACGLGMCAAFADDIKNSSETMTDAVGKTLSPIINLYQKLRSDIFEVAERLVDEGYDAPKQEIRVAVNNLLIRLAAVCMTVSKGRGFLQSRPEQRLLREAMFFLVWSLPDEGRAATIEALVGRSDP